MNEFIIRMIHFSVVSGFENAIVIKVKKKLNVLNTILT